MTSLNGCFQIFKFYIFFNETLITHFVLIKQYVCVNLTCIYHFENNTFKSCDYAVCHITNTNLTFIYGGHKVGNNQTGLILEKLIEWRYRKCESLDWNYPAKIIYMHWLNSQRSSFSHAEVRGGGPNSVQRGGGGGLRLPAGTDPFHNFW